MCIAIIKAERLSYEEMQGIGINTLFTEYSDPIEELNKKSSPGKRYLGSPDSTFRGKVVLCIVTYSSGRGIN